MKYKKVIQRENPYLLSYSDLMAALLLVFILLLTVTMLKLQKELDQSKEQAQRITVIKDEIIAELKKAFEDEGVEGVEVDSTTGAIKLKSNLFFDVGQSTLRQSGKDFLDQFMPIYLNVLLDSRFSDDITQIIIEGHTDPQPYVGGINRHKYSYIQNLELSHRRAYAVVNYILMESDYSKMGLTKEYTNLTAYSDKLKKLLTANGASFSAPLDKDGNLISIVPFDAIADGSFRPEDSDIDYEKSRRVEFKFRLNDEEYLRQIRDILQGIKGK